MQRSRTALLVAVLAAAMCPPAAPAVARTADAALVAHLNAARAAHGAPALRRSSRLARASRRAATRILRTDTLAHSRLRTGYFDLVGETLAWHAGRRARARQTVRRWLASPPHRAVLLDPRFRWVGVRRSSGVVGGRRTTVWVVRVGRR